MMRQYWAFYWPLALTASLMLVGLQVFIAVLARCPDGEMQLAVFAYAMGVFFLFDVATAFLPQLVTVFCRSAPARRQVLRFCLAVGCMLSLPVAFIAFSASGEALLARMYSIEGAVLNDVRTYLQLLSGIILVHVGQQYLTGLLVQAERTGLVSLIGLSTVIIQISAALLGYNAGWSPQWTRRRAMPWSLT